MVTITNGEVLNALVAAKGLMNEKLPPRGALKVRKIDRDLTTAWGDVEAVRQGLIDEYAERDDAGAVVNGEPIDGQTTVKIAAEHREAFNAAWAELMGAEVPAPAVLSVEDFGSAEIAPAVLVALGNLVSDE